MPARMYQPAELIRGTVYRVVRHIATGGMGSVFDVEDTTVGKRYVLKTLHPDLFGRNDLARRMEQEARVLARLQHPNIVEVVTAGETQDELKLPYYVMERLNGQNLRTVLEKKGALDRIHAYRIGIDLLDALAHAHDNGVIHRDVKPENVFLHRNLNGTTTTKLLDFGIMRLLDGAAKTDTMGRFVGTMRYASPEQVLVRELTPMTDVYSAGLVIYEMLAGQGPFDDIHDLTEVGRAQIQNPPPPLSRFVDLPRDVESLVLASLAKDPMQRPKDAFVYASDLRRMLRDAETAPKAQTQVHPLTESESRVPGFEQMATRQEEQGSTAMPPTPILTRAASYADPPTAVNPRLAPTQAALRSDPNISGSEATLVAPAPPAPGSPAAALPFKPTLLSMGTEPATLARGPAPSQTEPPTLVNQSPQAVTHMAQPSAPLNPVGPTLASNVGAAYLQAATPSALPPTPGTAMMPHPGPRPPGPTGPIGAPPTPMTMQPATPVMQALAPQHPYANAQQHHAMPAGPQRSPSFHPPQQAMSPQPMQAAPMQPPRAPSMHTPALHGGVDRNADTRAYQPPPHARGPQTDTQRIEDQGRTKSAPMDIVFPRGHGAAPQTSTGGVVAETSPSSLRTRKSVVPAIATGVGAALLMLVPTGFAMNRAMPARSAASHASASAMASSLAPLAPTIASVTAPPSSSSPPSAPSVAALLGVAPEASAAASAPPQPMQPIASAAPQSSDAPRAKPAHASSSRASSSAVPKRDEAKSPTEKPATKAAALPGVDL